MARTIDSFTGNIDADDRLRGRFSYQVNVAGHGAGRVHVCGWDRDETLKHLQSQPFFAEFAAAIKKFSGGDVKSTGFNWLACTNGAAS